MQVMANLDIATRKMRTRGSMGTAMGTEVS
jgi:hypothetical protein